MKQKVRCPWCQGTKTQRRGDYPKTRYHCQNPKCPHPWFYLEDAKVPLITVLDIETLPIHARTWNIGKTRLSMDNIIKDWCLLGYSYKTLFSAEVKGEVLNPKEAVAHNDERLARNLWNILDRSDIVISHNGLSFDLPKINARLIKYGLPPPTPYRQIDTLQAARAGFNFTSNKLDYLGEYLGFGRKIHTTYQLWIDCDNGNKDALQEMLTYNMRDVTLLEDVYTVLRPWIPTHPNLSLYVNDDSANRKCRTCLSDNIDWGEEYVTNASVFDAYVCNNCGTHGRKDKRKRTTKIR
jgi:DNA polymerase III epsilon subunit-like protein